MNPVKVLIVAGILLFGLILYAVFVPSPTIAADCATYDAELANAKSQGAAAFEIPPANLAKVVADTEAVTGDHYVDVSRGFLIFLPNVLLIGFETHGCLYAPILIARPKPEAGA